ncbi:MAG TPA: hypothetical protein VIC26_12260 [Marinagarivorans sp.]
MRLLAFCGRSRQRRQGLLWRAKPLLVVLALFVAGCDGGALATNSSAGNASSSVAGGVDAPCEAPVGHSLSDIASVVDWINAMPKPLSLACFVKSIPRPVYYNATLSSFSAQPSIGKRSPRVFFMIDKLILTMVPDEKSDTVKDPLTGKNLKDPETGLDVKVWDADGSQLLELSFEVETDLEAPQSIKGELKFPITDTLPRNAPYVKINFDDDNDLSICAFCHDTEVEVTVLDGQPVYRSEMLRNRRDTEVPLGFMLNEYAACDPERGENEWYRCEMLDAIYGQGTLVWLSFPESMPTIFDL